MGEEKLFYTYIGKWNNNVIPTSVVHSDSLIFHERTKRLIHNGTIYGTGIEGDVYFVEGNDNDNIGEWTGENVNINEYYDGLSIIYVPKVRGSGITTTLNINELGTVTCYMNNNKLTTEYPPNVPLLLTYFNNSWKRPDYDTDTDEHNSKVYNKDGQNYSYNIVFTEKNNNGTYSFAYVDVELNYNPFTNTLTASNFHGNLTGNVTGNTSSADRLYGDDSYTAWGRTFWSNGIPQSLEGDIENTYNILPAEHNTYNIGAEDNQYSYVYSESFVGNLYGTSSYAINSTYANLSNVSYISRLQQINDNTDFYIQFGNLIDYSYSYIDQGLRYNPFTNTLTTNVLVGRLESLDCINNSSIISNVDRRVITNIGISNNKKVSYIYADSIGVSYFNGTSYLGEIFNDYDNNVAYGIYGSSFGRHNITYNESEVAFGSYNAYNTTQIFSIGNGTSNSDRNNAIWIDINNATYTHNVIPQGNKTYNIGDANHRYKTIYGDIFNGTSFTGKANNVNVNSNNDIEPKYVVGFKNNELYYENSLTFTNDGQLTSSTPSGTPPFIVSSTTKVSNLNVDRLDDYHANKLLEKFEINTYENTNGAYLTYTIQIGGATRTGRQDLYNRRLAGNNSYTAWGQTFWSNGVPNSIEGTISNTYNITPYSSYTHTLGSPSNFWDFTYSKSIYTSLISFDGNKDIGNNINFIYWKDGAPKASTATLGNSGKPVYLNNGSFVECISFDDWNLITITKNLQVTTNWMDTGITTDSTTFPKGNGTYIVQIDATNISNGTDLWPSIYSGIMTIYNGTNNDSETDEVVLHWSGHASVKRLYLRTIPTLVSAGYSKLQISSSADLSQAYDIVFKFKKMI